MTTLVPVKTIGEQIASNHAWREQQAKASNSGGRDRRERELAEEIDKAVDELVAFEREACIQANAKIAYELNVNHPLDVRLRSEREAADRNQTRPLT